MRGKQFGPTPVTEANRVLSGADHIGEKHSGQDAIDVAGSELPG